METIEMYDNEVLELTNNILNKTKELNKLRKKASIFRDKKISLTQFSVLSSSTILGSIIVFALNPASLPFILTASSLFALGGSGIVTTALKNKSYNNKIKELNEKIESMENEIDNLRIELDKKHGQIATENKKRLYSLKKLTSVKKDEKTVNVQNNNNDLIKS